MIINSQRFLRTAVVMLALTAASFAQISVAVSFGPPPLPVYAQPVCPGEGYIWTPGYWAYDYDAGDYYWVPGTWVLAPAVGFLWTPGWWGWGGTGFIFHEGFWGPVVGFYGGINYGYGYFGHGYEGGRWENNRFYYNRAVSNVNVSNIHNVYNTTVINNTTVNRTSYSGGNGGISARPTSQEEAAARERRMPLVAAQTQHVEAARANGQLRASVNHGKPPIAATAKPAAFQGSGVVPAKQSGGPYTPPPNRALRADSQTQATRPQNTVPRPPENNAQAGHPENNVPRPSTAVHPNELPPIPHTALPKTGNAETDRQYQQQQDQMRAQQAQERQKLQQQQEQQHQQLAQQQANQARQQQLEQQHQKQTQELQQQHQQQQEQLARQQQQQLQARQQQPRASQPPASRPKP